MHDIIEKETNIMITQKFYSFKETDIMITHKFCSIKETNITITRTSSYSIKTPSFQDVDLKN
jgi:hypothetical protein